MPSPIETFDDVHLSYAATFFGKHELSRIANTPQNIALSSIQFEITRRNDNRYNAPEFLVKVVDPCDESLKEFAAAQEQWIEKCGFHAKALARAKLRHEWAKGTTATAARELARLTIEMDEVRKMADACTSNPP